MMSSRVSVAVVGRLMAQPSGARISALVGTPVPEVTRTCSNGVDLVVGGAPHLADTFGDAVHPVDVGLAEQAAVGVDRQLAAERKALDRREVLGLATTAEPQLLELGEHERGEVVVEERGLNVGGFESGVAPKLFGRPPPSRAVR